MGRADVIGLASLAALAYHYAGYPMLLYVWMRFRSGRPSASSVEISQPVTVVLSVHNEAPGLAGRLENLIDTAPAGSDIVVVSDGSTDETCAIARDFAPRGVRLVEQSPRQGKGAAINAGVAASKGEIVILTDANARFEAGAVAALSAAFADPDVAIVSGSLKLSGNDAAGLEGSVGAGEGLYWRYESEIRRLETRIRSTVAVVGPILAVRRACWSPIPPGIINDDAFLALRALARRQRVVYVSEAVCRRIPSRDLVRERERRARMAAGRYQLLARADLWPWHSATLLLFWISHKVMRVLSPVFLVLLALATVAALAGGATGPWWHAVAIAQAAFYAISLTGMMGFGTGHGVFAKASRLAALFLQVNIGAASGFWRFVLQRQSALWARTR